MLIGHSKFGTEIKTFEEDLMVSSLIKFLEKESQAYKVHIGMVDPKGEGVKTEI